MTSSFAKANNNGPSANGDFKFTLEDGLERSVQFNARIHNDGGSTGEMTFTRQADLGCL
jgi:hypothetical protein